MRASALNIHKHKQKQNKTKQNKTKHNKTKQNKTKTKTKQKKEGGEGGGREGGGGQKNKLAVAFLKVQWRNNTNIWCCFNTDVSVSSLQQPGKTLKVKLEC